MKTVEDRNDISQPQFPFLGTFSVALTAEVSNGTENLLRFIQWD